MKNISDALLERLFVQMLKIRLTEEKIASEYQKQEMRCPVHLSIGQEAIAVGVCNALSSGDFVLSTHRSHAHYLARGGGLDTMIAELFGKETGCCRGNGGSMHLNDPDLGFFADPIVGSTIPIAVGIAFGMWLQQKPNVAVAFFGEAATEEGVFSESLNFAALHKLPVLFVCENNQYSVYSHLSVRQPPDRDLLGIAVAHGVSAVSCDGNDVAAVFRCASKAVDSVRGGVGPVLIELPTYRKFEHCGPNNDDHLNYRPKEDIDYWEDKDPLAILKRTLPGIENRPEVKRQLEAIKIEIEHAFDLARAATFPPTQAIHRYTYAR